MRPYLYTVIAGVIGLALLLPVYIISPTFNVNSLSAYYLAGFILIEAFLFLSTEGTKRRSDFGLRKTDQDSFWKGQTAV